MDFYSQPYVYEDASLRQALFNPTQYTDKGPHRVTVTVRPFVNGADDAMMHYEPGIDAGGAHGPMIVMLDASGKLNYGATNWPSGTFVVNAGTGYHFMAEQGDYSQGMAAWGIHSPRRAVPTGSAANDYSPGYVSASVAIDWLGGNTTCRITSAGGEQSWLGWDFIPPDSQTAQPVGLLCDAAHNIETRFWPAIGYSETGPPTIHTIPVAEWGFYNFRPLSPLRHMQWGRAILAGVPAQGVDDTYRRIGLGFDGTGRPGIDLPDAFRFCWAQCKTGSTVRQYDVTFPDFITPATQQATVAGVTVDADGSIIALTAGDQGIGYGSTTPWDNLSPGAGNLSCTITDTTGTGAVINLRVDTNGKTIGFQILNGGTGYTSPTVSCAAPQASRLRNIPAITTTQDEFFGNWTQMNDATIAPYDGTASTEGQPQMVVVPDNVASPLDASGYVEDVYNLYLLRKTQLDARNRSASTVKLLFYYEGSDFDYEGSEPGFKPVAFMPPGTSDADAIAAILDQRRLANTYTSWDFVDKGDGDTYIGHFAVAEIETVATDWATMPNFGGRNTHFTTEPGGAATSDPLTLGPFGLSGDGQTGEPDDRWPPWHGFAARWAWLEFAMPPAKLPFSCDGPGGVVFGHQPE